MDCLLQPVSNASAYIDDICIHTDSREEHLKTLREVLKILHGIGFTLKLVKCVFVRATVTYLGYQIGGGTIAPMQLKVKAIQEMLLLPTQKGLRHFLGMVLYYRHFVPHFASIAAPLHTLTSKKRPKKIAWGEKTISAFQQLKEALIKATALHAPQYNQP